MEVRFYDRVEDEKLKFAVIAAKSQGKWVFCKHKERKTFEFPGGHREEGESIDEAARRELREETGALKFDIEPVCIYSVTGKTRANESGGESYGKLYIAHIFSFEKELHSEIERIVLLERPEVEWTYPLIQPRLLGELERRNFK